jgi:small GTP-binding protein
VVLAGRANAGKSSLFNALLKEDRAIVAPTPGTTRDALESPASFDGLNVKLYDTAGLRATDDPIEQMGVARTRRLVEAADCILYVIDATEGPNGEDKNFLEKYPHEIKIHNKLDSISSVSSVSSVPSVTPNSVSSVVQSSPYYTDFKAALENDLGTPKALSVLQVMIKDKDLSPAEKKALLTAMDSVLGLNLEGGAADFAAHAAVASVTTTEDAEIDALVAERLEAKKAKNFARADEIRGILTDRGITVADSPTGTTWRRSP